MNNFKFASLNIVFVFDLSLCSSKIYDLTIADLNILVSSICRFFIENIWFERCRAKHTRLFKMSLFSDMYNLKCADANIICVNVSLFSKMYKLKLADLNVLCVPNCRFHKKVQFLKLQISTYYLFKKLSLCSKPVQFENCRPKHTPF